MRLLTLFLILPLFGCGEAKRPATIESREVPAVLKVDKSPVAATTAETRSTEANADLVDSVADVPVKTNEDSPAQTDDSPAPTEYSPALTAFLSKFDELSAKGFVPTLRSGSTGIGYTLETMLNIEENNSPGGDFMGMELKAFRDDDLQMNDSEKMNLFLKEPAWIDGLKHSQRVKTYGYVDEDGRRALYSTVKARKNSHGFSFRVADDERRVYMQFKDDDIAFWTFAILEKRLKEKHSEAVFVAAHAKGKGRDEQFHYYAVTWCRKPDADSFVKLIQSGDVMLELRMHLKENGSVRNHGSAFRIKQNRIPSLYATTLQVRPQELQP